MDTIDSHYLSRSWTQLTKSKGWIKPVLVLAVSMFVPIFGMLAVQGYAVEWARLSAWGYDSSPKQKNVSVGGCIASGWRTFVVLFVWDVVLTLIYTLCMVCINTIFQEGNIVLSLLSICCLVLFSFSTLIAMVAALRAAIYEKISAGFKIARVFELVKEAPKELFKILVIPVVFYFISAAISWLYYAVVIALLLPDFYQLIDLLYYGSVGSYSYEIAQALGSIARIGLPAICIFLFIIFVIGTFRTLLNFNAVGLWLRRFSLASWGDPDEPLYRGPLALPAPSNVENNDDNFNESF